MKSKFYLILLLATFTCCYRVPQKIEPQVDFAVQDKYLQSLPSPFSTLTLLEKQEEWAKEYRIAMGFAHELDLYQAITAFKRAEFLLPAGKKERKMELEYEIMLCYFLAQKYSEVISTIEKGDLRFVDHSFPAYQDFLLILYESYEKTGEYDKAQHVLDLLKQTDPSYAEKIILSTALLKAQFDILDQSEDSKIQTLVSTYDSSKKSIKTAQMLNAFLPGAGYLYLGQKQSALTASLLNGLFIFAAYQFFHRGYIAAGAITTSFEMGWYFGGIYGAGEETKLYNERLYERLAYPLLQEKHLFPTLMIRYGF